MINFLVKIENKIRQFFNLIPTDKKEHFILGALFSSFILSILRLSIKSVALDYSITIILLVLFGLGIEFFQKYTKSGNYDLYDASATILGGLIVIIPFMI